MSAPDWLNGWPRLGPTDVLIGAGTHCVCCGRPTGSVALVVDEEWEPPSELPTWPFPEDSCPLCSRVEPPPRGPVDPCRVCGGTGERRRVALP